MQNKENNNFMENFSPWKIIIQRLTSIIQIDTDHSLKAQEGKYRSSKINNYQKKFSCETICQKEVKW